MSVGTSDTTVISSTKTEARNLNAIDASAAQRDDSSPAPKNRQHRFELVSHTDRNAGEILDYITRNYQHDMVMGCDSLELFNTLEKSPL